jgi:uncharacterized protein (TIGR02611 family)
MSPVKWVGRHAKRMVILVVGCGVVAAGVAMLALPGPGVVVIILGLVILSQEFAWAQRWLDVVVEKTADATSKVTESKSGRIALAASGVGMIVVGVAICVLYSKFIVAGISVVLAGIVALLTLHPRVHEWIEAKAATGINATDDVA